MLYQKVHQIHNSGVWKQQLQLHTGNSRSESLSVINIMIARGMAGLKGHLHPKVGVIVYLRWIKILCG